MKRGLTKGERDLLRVMGEAAEPLSIYALASLLDQPIPTVRYRMRHFVREGFAERAGNTSPHEFRIKEKKS